MTAILPIRSAAPAAANNSWRRHLAGLGVASAALLLLYRADVGDIVRIWLDSSTFNHCVLIPPIIAWLVWQRVPELRQLRPAIWWPGLLFVAAGGFAWLIGEAGGVALARHIGLVAMLQGLVITLLGHRAARGLTFPLFYAVFLIPAGEEIVPLMQTVTAHICMALLGLAGIPAHIEGVFITTPSGPFEVAEACSGVKFLVAMVAYGALVANLCFTSWNRRILFMAAAIVIPVIANGIRAWATIYVASFTSADYATGFDHIVYGWIFFAIVIALLMAVGWRFFDRAPSDPWIDVSRLAVASSDSPPRDRWLAGTGAAILVAAMAFAWAQVPAVAAGAALPATIEMPAPAGWTRTPDQTDRPWQPHFAGADRIYSAHYRDAAGHAVDLYVVAFARQSEGQELVGYGQGAVGPDSHWAWTANGDAPPHGKLERIASFGTIREVATFYRIGGILTGNPLEVKVETMKTRLLGRTPRAAAVLVSAEAPGEGLSARPAIDAFLADIGPVDQLADRALGGS